jgi:His-Xaa-Ser system protein HxsD
VAGQHAAQQAPSYEIDELGACSSVSIDLSVYGLTAVFKAAYWYTERFYLFLSREDGADWLRVEIRPKQALDRQDLEAACRDFCNALIDQRVRQVVIEETGEIREALVRKAFGEGRKHLDPARLGSDESNVPEAEASFKSDPLGIGRPTGE